MNTKQRAHNVCAQSTDYLPTRPLTPIEPIVHTNKIFDIVLSELWNLKSMHKWQRTLTHRFVYVCIYWTSLQCIPYRTMNNKFDEHSVAMFNALTQRLCTFCVFKKCWKRLCECDAIWIYISSTTTNCWRTNLTVSMYFKSGCAHMRVCVCVSLLKINRFIKCCLLLQTVEIESVQCICRYEIKLVQAVCLQCVWFMYYVCVCVSVSVYVYRVPAYENGKCFILICSVLLFLVMSLQLN